MIDTRCHIFDGTGCGPSSFSESLQMCDAAIEGGVGTIVAMLRWQAGAADPPLTFSEIEGKLERLRGERRGALEFTYGFALEIGPGLPALIDRYGSRLALAGHRHLFLSVPPTQVPAEMRQVRDALSRRDLSAVVAHPECSPALRRSPSTFGEWVASGWKLQVDAASVVGSYGREVRKFANNLLRQYEGSVMVASNARGPRENLLQAAHAELITQFGAGRAAMFVRQIPLEVLCNVKTASRMSLKANTSGKLNTLSSIVNSIRSFKPQA
jgi:protein-tyrosine phosphatase